MWKPFRVILGMWEGLDTCCCSLEKRGLVNSANLSVYRALHPHYCLLCSLPWLPIQPVVGMKIHIRRTLYEDGSSGKSRPIQLLPFADEDPEAQRGCPVRAKTPTANYGHKCGHYIQPKHCSVGSPQPGALARLLVWLMLDLTKKHKYLTEFALALAGGGGATC